MIVCGWTLTACLTEVLINGERYGHPYEGEDEEVK